VAGSFRSMVEFQVSKGLKRVLASLLLAGLALGCGGSQEKGVNSGLDRPVPAKKAPPGGDEKTK